MNPETKKATLLIAPGYDLNLEKRYCLVLEDDEGMKARITYGIKTWCYGCRRTDECRKLNNG